MLISSLSLHLQMAYQESSSRNRRKRILEYARKIIQLDPSPLSPIDPRETRQVSNRKLIAHDPRATAIACTFVSTGC